MTNKKFNWEGDLDDDCTCHWNNLFLRAEKMEENNWWWAITDVAYNKEIASSNDYHYTCTSGKSARKTAELKAVQYFRHNHGLKPE